jgi:phosphinothricin acetyltransferase
MNLIRTARETDAAAMLAIYEPFVRGSSVTFEITPPTEAEFKSRVARTLTQNPWLVHESNPGAVDGYAYATAHRERAAYQWTVEVSVYVAATRYRGGIGKALYTALFEILRKQGYRNALAGITIPNPASVGFHESLGFERIANYPNVGYKLGYWHDVGWWQLELQELRGAPTTPISFPVLPSGL